MDPSGAVDSPIPLADITNNITQGVLDRRERKRQRDRERYASMSTEKKDELNRKRRERRMEQNRCDQVSTYRMDENASNNGTHEEGLIGQHGTATDVRNPNERRRQRYASMPKEQKDELNRKRRESRLDNKGRAHGNKTCDGTNQENHCQAASHGEQAILPTANESDVSVSRDEAEDNEWMHTRHFNQNNDVPGVSESMDEDENNEWLHRGNLSQTNDLPVGSEILISAKTNDDCIDDKVIESTVADGGKIKCFMILCVGWCFSSTWFVSIQSSRNLGAACIYMTSWESDKKVDICTDTLAMRRNFFVDLVAHEANAWRKRLPSIVKHYLQRITGRNIE